MQLMIAISIFLAASLSALAPCAEASALEIVSVVQRPISGSIGPRAQAGGTIFYQNGAWKLFAAGGIMPGGSPYYKDIVIFDLSTNTWSSTGLNHNIDAGNGGANFACAWDHESAIYCAGGTDPGTNGPVPSVKGFRYSIGTNTLTALPDLPIARRGACGTFYGGKFFIFGGLTICQNSCPEYQWFGSLISLNVSAPGAQWEVETPETASAASWVPDCTRAGSKFYILGSTTSCGFYPGCSPDIRVTKLMEIDLSSAVARPRPIRVISQSNINSYAAILGTCSGMVFYYNFDPQYNPFRIQAFSFDPTSTTGDSAAVSISGITGNAPTVELWYSVYGSDENCRIYAGTGFKREYLNSPVNDVYEIQLRVVTPTPSPTPTPVPKVLEIVSVVQRPAAVSGSIAKRGNEGSAAFYHNGSWKLFVAGGYHPLMKDIIIFDLSTNTWTATGQNMPTSGYDGSVNFACAWDHESAVYCAGGLNVNTGYWPSTRAQWSSAMSANVFKYTYGSNTVTALASLPVARRGPCVAFYAGRLWVFGGDNYGAPEISSQYFLGDLLSLNVSAPGAQWEVETPHSASVALFSATHIRIGSKMYMHAGQFSNAILEVDLSPSVARPRPIRNLAQFGWQNFGATPGSCSGLYFTYQYDPHNLSANAYSYDPASGTSSFVAVGGLTGSAPLARVFLGGYGEGDNCQAFAFAGSLTESEFSLNVYEIKLRVRPQASATAPTYRGCFGFSEGVAAALATQANSSVGPWDACAAAAGASGLRFFGLSNGGALCVASASLDAASRLGPSDTCAVCISDQLPDARCGQASSVAIYDMRIADAQKDPCASYPKSSGATVRLCVKGPFGGN